MFKPDYHYATWVTKLWCDITFWCRDSCLMTLPLLSSGANFDCPFCVQTVFSNRHVWVVPQKPPSSLVSRPDSSMFVKKNYSEPFWFKFYFEGGAPTEGEETGAGFGLGIKNFSLASMKSLQHQWGYKIFPSFNPIFDTLCLHNSFVLHEACNFTPKIWL